MIDYEVLKQERAQWAKEKSELLEALQVAYEHINGGSGIKNGSEFHAMWEQIRAAISKARGET